MNTHDNIGNRHHVPTPVNAHYMTARPRGVCANRQRRERQRGGLAGRGDERPMNQYLDVIIPRMEHRRLVEEQLVFRIGIPADCVGCWLGGKKRRGDAEETRTVVGHGINPLV